MNIGYENIPVPAWQNETLLPGTVHPEEKNLRPKGHWNCKYTVDREIAGS